jgi:DNA-binding cell septation regulator SpoVG
MKFPEVSEIEIRVNTRPVVPRQVSVVAWASFVLDDAIKIREAVIMRNEQGRLTLRWPQIRTANGRYNTIVFPISKAVARAVEEAVLAGFSNLSSTDKLAAAFHPVRPNTNSRKGE